MEDIALTIFIFLTCLILSIQDIKSRKINLPFLATAYLAQGACYFIAGGSGLFLPRFIDSLILFLAYLLLWLFSRKKFGFGDVLFSLFCGFCIFEWEKLWLMLLLPVLGAIFFLLLLLIIKRKADFSTFRLPYIPFMSLSLIVLLIL